MKKIWVKSTSVSYTHLDVYKRQVLGDTPYYESLEASTKIRKYVKQRNVSQMPKSAQDIIRDQQEEATKLSLIHIYIT